MRLFGCRCSARRRRASLITQVLGLLLMVVVTTWVVLLVLQVGQESLTLRRSQAVSAVDYEIYKANPHHSDSVVTRNKSVNRLAETAVNNGRQPKGLDIALPAIEKHNSTIREHSTTSHPTSQPTSAIVNDTRATVMRSQNTVVVGTKEQITIDSLPSQIGPDSLQLLKDYMFKLNKEQRIQNVDKFPPMAKDGIVLIVQVHRRDGYLRQLFNSMRKVQGIEEVLLVISHDYYYDDIMKLVRSVDFCRVIQIFYPFSLQVYPDTFPGASKDDCPRDSTREEAHAMNCTNALHPDTYGHYREAKITAVKHHWWWKLNMVFDGMRETKNFSGHVIFLEEDHYLSPDFLYVAKKLIALKEELNHRDHDPQMLDFVNLGMYSNVKTTSKLGHRVSVGIWNAGKNNMGFGMNRETWEQIKSCKEHFCTYDDYNWDWSLNSMGHSCLQRQLKVLVTKAPRIFHIGNCGVHHTKECNEERDAQKVISKLDSQKGSLFPESLHLDTGLNPSASRKKFKPFGGWGDVRDQHLCLSFVGDALRKVL